MWLVSRLIDFRMRASFGCSNGVVWKFANSLCFFHQGFRLVLLTRIVIV
jgi:hypothetical protein